MNVVGYIRVSTDGQVGDDKYGIARQEKDIKDYCDKNGHILLDIYVDEGKSGAKEDRPALDTIVYGKMSNPPVEAIVVSKSDRLARDINIYYHYKYELLKKNMKLISIEEDFGAFGAMATVYEAIIAAFAQLDRENINKRMTAGRTIKATKGAFSGGRAPFGYSVEDGFYVVNEDEAQTVREIFSLYRSGVGIREIERRLVSNGVLGRSGNPINFATIRSILSNEKTYLGYYRYGCEKDENGHTVFDSETGKPRKIQNWIKGVHEPLIEELPDGEGRAVPIHRGDGKNQ